MNTTMAISRSCEEGMSLLRANHCVWRVNEEGVIDCTAQGPLRLFELLRFLQQCKAPTRRIFLNYPLQESSD
ncbi:MAG: hypothetical protein OEZ05_00460 [Nitrospirota bacterium]|nr:hypothetical protein [Nitrospirota bacterium]MDH5585079.1 hypothetical protein [Nitrospirota bacterium]